MALSSLLIIFSSSFMALFPVINPLGNGFVVNGFFADLDPSQRKTAIQKLTINFIMIGVGTLLVIALVIICMAGILYVFLSQGQRIIQKLGLVGNQIINKLVAFFTFCIGIQISVTGISQIFHLNIL